MSISDILEKIKGGVEILRGRDVGLILVMVLSVSAAFGLGRLSALETSESAMTFRSSEGSDISADLAAVGAAPSAPEKPSAPATNQTGSGIVVASKNGEKYHYPWCSGAKSISEQNKITFASVEAARAAGYTPAANCKGLK